MTSRTWIGAAIVVALALRIVLAFHSPSPPVGDEIGYRDTARSIAAGNGHVSGGNLVFKAPLYSTMLAGVYWLGGDDLAVRLTQALIGTAMVGLVAWIAFAFVNSASAVGAAWMVACYPMFLILTPRLLSEALFNVLVVASIASLAWLIAAPGWRRAVLLGAVCGFVALTRSAGIGLAVALTSVFVIAARTTPVRARLLLSAAILASMALVIAPWTVRNWMRVHAFVPVSVESGRVLYSGWVSVPGERVFGSTAVDANTFYADTKLAELARDAYLGEKAIDYIRTRPDLIPRYVFLKSLYFWSPIDWDTIGYGEGTYNGVYAALVPFVLIGIWHTARHAPMALAVCAVTVAYFWAIALIGSTTPRYRYPVDAMLFVIAAAGVAWFLGDAATRRRRLLIAVPWFVLNVTAIAFSTQAKLALRDVLVAAGLW